ncbi:MAG: hypothetical protein V1820_03435 [archaeon]
MAWILEIALLASLLLLAAALFRKSPATFAAVSAIILLFFAPRLLWTDYQRTYAGSFLGRKAVEFSESFLGYYPLDSTDEQASWFSDNRAQAFRDDGIHLVGVGKNCLAPSVVSRELPLNRMPLTFRACSGKSGGDGASFYFSVWPKKVSEIIKVPENSCISVYINKTMGSGSKIYFASLPEGNCDEEDIVLKAFVAGAFGREVSLGSSLDFSEIRISQTSDSCGISLQGGIQLSGCGGCNGTNWVEFSPAHFERPGNLSFIACGGNRSSSTQVLVEASGEKYAFPLDFLSCSDYFIPGEIARANFTLSASGAGCESASATILRLRFVQRGPEGLERPLSANTEAG